MTRRIWAKLVNEQHNYDVPIDIQLRELWGTNPVPDGYVTERLMLAPGCGIALDDGNYALAYEVNGQSQQMPVRVSDGMLLSS